MLSTPRYQRLGPALASPGDKAALRGCEWRRNPSAADYEWLKKRPLLVLVSYAVLVFFLFNLVRGQYPRWRILAATGILGALSSVLWALRAAARRNPDRVHHTRLRLVAFPLLLLSAAITGGLHSPMFACTLGVPLGLFVVHGWSREAKGTFFLTVAWTISLVAMPESWLGPVLAEPYYSLSTAVFFVMTFGIAADQLVALTTAINANLRKLVRLQEQAATEALARARDLELLGSKLSHELKNPLGAIKALVQLSRRAARDPEARERLEVIEGEIERMNGIVQGYLTFSRPLDGLHTEDVSLGELADDTLSVLEARALASEVALRRRGDAQVRADVRRLREALLNLLVNALEATERGGAVEVAIREGDGMAEVRIRDTGRGMPPEVLSRLGEPFFTTRDKGTGLGVLLARSAFVQHGGTLEYQSAPGQGTTAIGSLPLADRERRGDGAIAFGR